MDTLNDYTIQFSGLKQGTYSFTYHIDNKFFDDFKYDDFQSINCDIDLVLIKKATLIELHFTAKGVATLVCDLSNEIFDKKLDNQLDMIIKFGSTFNDEEDNLLIIPHSEYQLSIAQYIYEVIVLALPIKRIHPGIAEGTLKSKVLEKLEELEIRNHKETDPRWDKLNELLISKKT